MPGKPVMGVVRRSQSMRLRPALAGMNAEPPPRRRPPVGAAVVVVAVSFSQRRSTVPVESSTSRKARCGALASCQVSVTGRPERMAAGGVKSVAFDEAMRALA